MKKIFVLFLLLIFISPCFAAEWVQVADKTWFDSSSVQREGDIVSGWFKDLNPGDWQTIKNKKIWFNITLFSADCSKRKIKIKSSTSYDLKGNVLFNFTDSVYKEVIPDTVGEWKYTILCAY